MIYLLYMSRTYNPSKVKRAKKHGFLSRSKTTRGKKTILSRMRKGRHSLTVSTKTSKKRV
jgi:large subunit ribosomal protein L34